ncbi:MAG: hypothetical protein K2I35_00290, partial [Duncaniella sp.]|nr:hypothetical protein [Duncaniella sp.]
MTNILLGILLAATMSCNGNSTDGTVSADNASNSPGNEPGIQTLNTEASVMPGIEVLAEENFARLKGKRVGLITNPTGIDN